MPDDFLCFPAEYEFGADVPARDAPIAVERDHGVVRSVAQNRVKEDFGLDGSRLALALAGAHGRVLVLRSADG